MLRSLVLPLLGTLAASTVLAAPAYAAPAPVATPSLHCQVLPSGVPPRPGLCGTFRAAGTYIIDNVVRNGPASGYSWTVPDGVRVVAGCAVETPFCDLSVRSVAFDQEFTTSVVIPGVGTQTARAVLPAVCGRFLC